MKPDVLRKLNLIEVLNEDATAAGLPVLHIPDHDLGLWSEQRIWKFFKDHSDGGNDPPSPKGIPKSASAPLLTLKKLIRSKTAPSFAKPSVGRHAPCAKPTWPEPSLDEFMKWFPGLNVSGTRAFFPRGTVLCFPSAGNAESMYTCEGTGPRRSPSPLLDWCRCNQVQMLAVQPPGRAQRIKEPQYWTLTDLVAGVLPVVAHTLCQMPYVVVAHSMGAWAAYEFLRMAKQRGLPMPQHLFVSAMPAPDIPFVDRPWRQQRLLNEEKFKDECTRWDINAAVFSPGVWAMYQPLLRADFKLFDEYECAKVVAPPFNFPITAFWGSQDQRITQDMVKAWERLTTGVFEVHRIEGNHLWPMEKDGKFDWQEIITDTLDREEFAQAVNGSV
eukprot:jgi/Chrzof1/9063/Cz03g34210.t1